MLRPVSCTVTCTKTPGGRSGGGKIGTVPLLRIARLLGAKQVLHKPFLYPELVATVRTVLDGRQLTSDTRGTADSRR
jgi:hypothetical protein